MRVIPWIAVLVVSCNVSFAEEPANGPQLLLKFDAFQTLVNPQCSHCRDEAKRRAADLRDDDPVLCWIRGYSDGGAIPIRFFLNTYRVISDSYGVFVYDPEAGYTRGFAPSYDFKFAGWRNGVMVMSHKDGTFYSCLTGIAFDGPKKGERLKPVPTLTSRWGFWIKHYPQTVAYHMFDKYQPKELPTESNSDEQKTRLPPDTRLGAEEMVLGVADGDSVRAYPVAALKESGLVRDRVGDQDRIIVWYGPTQTAAAYSTVATPQKADTAKPRALHFDLDPKSPDAALLDHETGSHWDVTGRAVDGELKGWTLDWLDGVKAKWFAWSAEYPKTTIYEAPKTGSLQEKTKMIAGTAEFLRAIPKRFATIKAIAADRHEVTMLIEGEADAKTWTIEPDAEIRRFGWWGRLEQFQVGERVWAWFKIDRRKEPLAIAMLCDEPTEQEMHGGSTLASRGAGEIVLHPLKGADRTLKLAGAEFYRGDQSISAEQLAVDSKAIVQSSEGRARLVLDAAAFEQRRAEQRRYLRDQWLTKGLPGTITFLHVFSGEMDLMLDHEAIRWGRSLKPGDEVRLSSGSDVTAVVKEMKPWHERTQLQLVVNGLDQADYKVGQRLACRMAAPPAAVDDSPFPPDMDRPRSAAERVEWFLASLYCDCQIGDDTCTGQFFTLASCNPNSCGLPNQMRATLREMIDRGSTDEQIFSELVKTRGADLLRPHLVP
jgi:hypothetical protein